MSNQNKNKMNNVVHIDRLEYFDLFLGQPGSDVGNYALCISSDEEREEEFWEAKAELKKQELQRIDPVAGWSLDRLDSPLHTNASEFSTFPVNFVSIKSKEKEGLAKVYPRNFKIPRLNASIKTPMANPLLGSTTEVDELSLLRFDCPQKTKNCSDDRKNESSALGASAVCSIRPETLDSDIITTSLINPLTSKSNLDDQLSSHENYPTSLHLAAQFSLIPDFSDGQASNGQASSCDLTNRTISIVSNSYDKLSSYENHPTTQQSQRLVPVGKTIANCSLIVKECSVVLYKLNQRQIACLQKPKKKKGLIHRRKTKPSIKKQVLKSKPQILNSKPQILNSKPVPNVRKKSAIKLSVVNWDILIITRTVQKTRLPIERAKTIKHPTPAIEPPIFPSMNLKNMTIEFETQVEERQFEIVETAHTYISNSLLKDDDPTTYIKLCTSNSGKCTSNPGIIDVNEVDKVTNDISMSESHDFLKRLTGFDFEDNPPDSHQSQPSPNSQAVECRNLSCEVSPSSPDVSNLPKISSVFSVATDTDLSFQDILEQTQPMEEMSKNQTQIEDFGRSVSSTDELSSPIIRIISRNSAEGQHFRKIKCEFCPTLFYSKVEKQVHMKSVHPYRCKCLLSFQLQQDLVEHKKKCTYFNFCKVCQVAVTKTRKKFHLISERHRRNYEVFQIGFSCGEQSRSNQDQPPLAIIGEDDAERVRNPLTPPPHINDIFQPVENSVENSKENSEVDEDVEEGVVEDESEVDLDFLKDFSRNRVDENNLNTPLILHDGDVLPDFENPSYEIQY